jgi:hypothetical protein
MGLEPGPHFKEILDAALEAQIDRHWESPDQAREWLLAYSR